MRALTAYGHSWVQGTGASAPDRRLATIAARAPGLAADNRGVSGTASTRTAGLVRAQPPPQAAAFLVLTGRNDVRLHGEVPAGYGAALDEVLRAIASASPGAPVAVVEQPHLLDYGRHAPHDRGSSALVERANEVLREVVADVGGAVAVRVTGWDPHTMLAEDAVHPNDAGHAEVAAAVTAAVTAALTRRAGT